MSTEEKFKAFFPDYTAPCVSERSKYKPGPLHHWLIWELPGWKAHHANEDAKLFEKDGYVWNLSWTRACGISGEHFGINLSLENPTAVLDQEKSTIASITINLIFYTPSSASKRIHDRGDFALAFSAAELSTPSIKEHIAEVSSYGCVTNFAERDATFGSDRMLSLRSLPDDLQVYAAIRVTIHPPEAIPRGPKSLTECVATLKGSEMLADLQISGSDGIVSVEF